MKINRCIQGRRRFTIRGKNNIKYLRKVRLCEYCQYFTENKCKKSYKKIFNEIGYCKHYKKRSGAQWKQGKLGANLTPIRN